MDWDGMIWMGVFFCRVELGRRFYFNISISSIFYSVLAFFPSLLSSFLPSLHFFSPSVLPSSFRSPSFYSPYLLSPVLLLAFLPPFLSHFFLSPLCLFSFLLPFVPSFLPEVRKVRNVPIDNYLCQVVCITLCCMAREVVWPCVWYNVLVMGWYKMNLGRMGWDERLLVVITVVGFCLVVGRLVVALMLVKRGVSW